MSSPERQLLSGDSAIALGAFHGGVALGTGYPGTPSTEILEYFSQIGGNAQWSPNEKVALEVGIGVAYAGARSLVTKSMPPWMVCAGSPCKPLKKRIIQKV